MLLLVNALILGLTVTSSVCLQSIEFGLFCTLDMAWFEWMSQAKKLREALKWVRESNPHQLIKRPVVPQKTICG